MCHIGCLQRLFESKLQDENSVENIDETHFIFNMDNGKITAILEAKVNYSDMVSVCDGFTVFLKLRGGAYVKLMQAFLIFKNRDRNYPMTNLSDSIETVPYRTLPRT